MRRIITLALLVASGIGVIARTALPAPPPAMTTAARAFIDSLTPEQKKVAQFPFDSEQRFVWFYTPVARQGLTLKAMTEPQRKLAMNLLRAGLSERGYSKAETIRSLEDVLVELGGNPVQRDRELYYFSIFGDPGPKATWGWRYEGHHLSQNWTIVNGTAMATTPQFFGANPAEVRQGTKQGLRALAAEEDLAFELLQSLDATQRQAAIIDPKSPNDILTTNTRVAAIQHDLGLNIATMTAAQKAIALRLIEVHAGTQTDAIAQDRIARAKNTLNLKFAWMGGTEKGQGHYYRIQAPSFLIEFDNTQNNANHIHQVWRSFNDGDWGRDLLAEHYHAAPHQP